MSENNKVSPQVEPQPDFRLPVKRKVIPYISLSRTDPGCFIHAPHYVIEEDPTGSGKDKITKVDLSEPLNDTSPEEVLRVMRVIEENRRRVMTQ